MPLEDFAQFRVDGAKPPVPKEWIPDVDPFKSTVGKLRVLSFDQTLANTGYAVVDFIDETRFEIVSTGMVQTPASDKGHRGNLFRSAQLSEEFRNLFHEIKPHAVALELPPIMNAYTRNNRPESSLMAATVIMTVVERYQRKRIGLQILQAQKVKKRWTGLPKADKNNLKRAMNHLFPEYREHKPNNDNTRDAIAIAMLAAEIGFDYDW